MAHLGRGRQNGARGQHLLVRHVPHPHGVAREPHAAVPDHRAEAPDGPGFQQRARAIGGPSLVQRSARIRGSDLGRAREGAQRAAQIALQRAHERPIGIVERLCDDARRLEGSAKRRRSSGGRLVGSSSFAHVEGDLYLEQADGRQRQHVVASRLRHDARKLRVARLRAPRDEREPQVVAVVALVVVRDARMRAHERGHPVEVAGFHGKRDERGCVADARRFEAGADASDDVGRARSLHRDERLLLRRAARIPQRRVGALAHGKLLLHAREHAAGDGRIEVDAQRAARLSGHDGLR